MITDRTVLEDLLTALRQAFPTERIFDDVMEMLPTEKHNAIGMAWAKAEDHMAIPLRDVCPFCKEGVGLPCRTRDGRIARRPHGHRGFVPVDPEYCPASTDHKHSESWYDCDPCEYCGDDSPPESCDCGKPGHAAEVAR